MHVVLPIHEKTTNIVRKTLLVFLRRETQETRTSVQIQLRHYFILFSNENIRNISLIVQIAFRRSRSVNIHINNCRQNVNKSCLQEQ